MSSNWYCTLATAVIKQPFLFATVFCTAICTANHMNSFTNAYVLLR